MSKVYVEINTDGDAFRNEDGTLNESVVAQMLKSLGHVLKQDPGRRRIPGLDFNGSLCATLVVEEDGDHRGGWTRPGAEDGA